VAIAIGFNPGSLRPIKNLSSDPTVVDMVMNVASSSRRPKGKFS
jgi:hypothetical protein